MKQRRAASMRMVVMMAAVLVPPAASLAQINVIMSGGFSAADRDLLPQPQKVVGISINTISGASQGNGPNTIGAQLRRGVPADVVIMSREALDDLIRAGRIVAGVDVDLAQTPLGMSVRRGASKPDISQRARSVQTVDCISQIGKGLGRQSKTAGWRRQILLSNPALQTAVDAP